MATRKRQTVNTAQKMGELALAAPQVVAHRLMRMAKAGPVLSAQDRQEFSGMVQEKHEAFVLSWFAMWGEAARAQQRLAFSWLSPRALMTPWSPRHAVAQLTQAHSVAQRFAAKGLAPVHRKAVANAKRLAKTKRR
jgi:hypothetical protein